jgi:8-oxo-dGTP pyrophosphatase MutT (NUDIX family)
MSAKRRKGEPAPAPAPTHAGGVVHRLNGGVREFLVVTARGRPDQWVLPKGHVEPGETPEAAAIREVEEEAGVVAALERHLEDVRLPGGPGDRRVRFFLLRYERAQPAGEGRRIAWLPLDAAALRLTFEDARRVLRAAAAAVEEER